MQMVHALQGQLHSVSLFPRSDVRHVVQAACHMLKQQLCVLQMPGIRSGNRLHLGGKRVDVRERCAGVLIVTRGDLPAREFGQTVQHLGEQVALIARLCGVGALLHLKKGCGIEWGLVRVRGSC